MFGNPREKPYRGMYGRINERKLFQGERMPYLDEMKHYQNAAIVFPTHERRLETHENQCPPGGGGPSCRYRYRGGGAP